MGIIWQFFFKGIIINCNAGSHLGGPGDMKDIFCIFPIVCEDNVRNNVAGLERCLLQGKSESGLFVLFKLFSKEQEHYQP